MVSISQYAKEYSPQQMKNISELEVVNTDADIKQEVRKNIEGEEYTVRFIVINGDEYRIPSSVIEQLKMFLESKPSLKTFKVKKTGQGMATKYQVIPLD